MAEALYRKYRPQIFEDVVGQEPIERTLKNAIAQDKVSHAYLFCGPRGTGKTTTARLLAKALLCQHGPTPDPDGTCEDCLLVADGTHPDVYELDAASRTGVENVREEIIDEVHMLSTAAFNALLKTLEEPPSHVVFILCTTDPQKVPETIHSRCQRFDFHRISPESMVARLGAVCMAEDVEFEGEALDLIAQRADGGLRDALTSLEQIIAFENGKVTLAGAERLLGSIDSNDLAEIMSYIGRRDIANCFKWIAAYVETGADLAQFARDMAEHGYEYWFICAQDDDDPDAERIVGYTGGHPEPETDRYFISKIYLKSDERGKHYASRVFEFYTQLCIERGFSAMYLTVNKYNELAIRAYVGKGFETIDSVETDIGEGFIMDDFVMQKTVTA